MAKKEEELEVIGERDIYTQTVADIPKDAKLLESIRNRPRAYVLLGVIALGIFIAMAPQYWIALSIAIVLCIVVFFLSPNEPVLDIYEGFVVCYKRGDTEKVCIIPEDEIIFWQLVSGNTSISQIHFVDKTDPENALCATIHTINSFQVTNALDHYFRDKSIVEIRREVSRKKSLFNRKGKGA